MNSVVGTRELKTLLQNIVNCFNRCCTSTEEVLRQRKGRRERERERERERGGGGGVGVVRAQREHKVWLSKAVVKHDRAWSPRGWVTVKC